MAVVKYKEAKKWINENSCPSFILLAGEGVLTREIFKILSKAILGTDNPSFAQETMDGTIMPMGDIMEQATTFSFLMSKKLILVKNAPLFATSVGQGEIQYSSKDFDLLTEHMEKGIPQDHFLVFTTPGLDRRKKIYKQFEKKGLIIDCVVSQGSRKADQDEQLAVLSAIAQKRLAKTGKKIDPRAFRELADRIGFNPDLLVQNLEKLVAYAGQQPIIDAKAVASVVSRDKKDPIFSLTNAVMEKDVKTSIFFLSSLVGDGYHPLQILKSLENLVRKLLVAKSFTLALGEKLPGFSMSRMNFTQFKQQIMPRIISRDQAHREAEEELEQRFKRNKEENKKTKVVSDLFLAPNPKSPYPVFQVLLKSEKFSFAELQCAMVALCDLDHCLKSSSLNPVTGLENFVMQLCTGGFHDSKNQDHRHHFQP